MTNKEKVMDFLQSNNHLFCDDCLSGKLKIEPRQQINRICRLLALNDDIYRFKGKCIFCNKNKMVNISALVKLKEYNDVYEMLKILLSRIDFDETLKLIQITHKKYMMNENPKIYFSAINDVLKADFLANTNSDIEAYNLIATLWINWFKKKINKSKVMILDHGLSFKLSLIDGNLGRIKELYHKYERKDKKNKEIRFYLILFGIVILHDIVIEQSDLLFATLLQGDLDRKRRKSLIRDYFKVHEIKVNKKKQKSDFSMLRDSIAHGKFITIDEKIILYHEEDTRPEILEYQEVIDMYNNVMVKFQFIELVFIIVLYMNLAQGKNIIIK